MSDSIGLMNSCSTTYADNLFFNSQTYYCQITDYLVLLVHSDSTITWVSQDVIIKGIVEREWIFLMTTSGVLICLKLIEDNLGDQKLYEINRMNLDFDVSCFCAVEFSNR